MEVTTPKQLHKHTVPIIMIALAFLFVAVATISGKVDSVAETESALAKSLTTNLVKIEPKPNGLAKVELNNPREDTIEPKAGASLDGLSQVGRSAQISLTLQ